ncbi:MAG: pentapeptide repeat-containing protein [Acidobacteriia bacterium]|nr:pentapeptide repeat-containing protein [Terriglobia bacterium]
MSLIPASELRSASDALAELFSVANLPAGDADVGARDKQAEDRAAHPATRLAEEMSQTSPPSASAPDPRGQTMPKSEPGSAGQVTMLAEALLNSLGTNFAAEESQMALETKTANNAPSAARDWAFEEKLAGHDEWVKSQGQAGKRGDFSGAELEGTELIGANLRFADLQDAKLTAADLLLADLRDACLVRANLEDSCLVGARLEGANLEGASLGTAMGLVPRQVAGANLRRASLPPDFLESIPTVAFERAAQAAARFLLVSLLVSLVSVLIIWRTRDAQLLTDSAIIPFLHSRTAAAALPTAEFYLVLPVLLFTLYLMFHFQLQRLWDAVAESPAVFPTGQTLGRQEPGLVGGLLRAHYPWIQPEASATRLVEKGISLALAYWIVPGILVLFWARYLTRQDIHGTILHAVLVVVSAGVALYATTRTGQAQEQWTPEEHSAPHPLTRKLRSVNPVAVALGCGAVLLFFSAGTIAGVPHDRSRAPQYGPGHIRRWASSALWTLGLDPYADLTEAAISTRPANWTGADSELAAVRGPRLADTNFRYAQAYGVFFVNAHLLRADFEGAFLPAADLRGADLGQSNLRYAVLDQAQMSHVNLDRSNLESANLARADLRDANLSHASLVGTILVDARLEGASLYAARLSSATLTRANLARADLRDAYADSAQMEHADFRGAYLWSAKLRGANLQGAHLQNAIAIDATLRGADLRGAEFAGTVLTGADLSETNLDGADLRGALGLSASQVCSATSRRGALLDDAMGLQVEAQCGK